MDAVFGAVFVLLGVLSLVMHVLRWLGVSIPAALGFGKLEAMQRTWGRSGGLVLHVFSYVVVPIAFGGVLLLRGS
ncbi:MAG: hypothetical protein QM765_45825 [Myxococcales bacterium]